MKLFVWFVHAVHENQEQNLENKLQRKCRIRHAFDFGKVVGFASGESMWHLPSFKG